MDNNPNDTLSLYKQIRLVNQLQKDERILFSCEILKFNDSNKTQPRIFLITMVAVYNVQRSQNFIKSMMSKLVNFNKKYTIRRSIPFGQIEGITLGTCEHNCEFVLHVKDDFDYRFRVDQARRKLLLKCLCLQYEKVNQKKMVFFFKDDISLTQYCTLKADLKHKINRMPKESGVFLNMQDFMDYQVSGAKFEPVYSHNGKPIEIENFVSSTLEDIKQQKKYFSIQSKTCKFEEMSPMLENTHQFISLPEYIYRVNKNLYLLRPLMTGGKMDRLIGTMGAFKKQLCIFYISQIIVVLEFLHARKWVYRAVSLSNFYIKENGYIAIDGLNKLMRKKLRPDQVFFDICGLPQDLSPEMILCEGHDESIDVWGLGLCAYHMIEGHNPFLSYNNKQTFRNILDKQIEEGQFLPSFVKRALEKDPQLRPTLSEIKKDPCFDSIDWSAIEKEQRISPYLPELSYVEGWSGKLPQIVCLSSEIKK